MLGLVCDSYEDKLRNLTGRVGGTINRSSIYGEFHWYADNTSD